MKQKIKFRAWDGNKIIYEFVVAGFEFVDCLSVMTDENFAIQTYGVTEWKIMQFTGLKDKNGKEIYEGDIVEVKKKSGFGTDKGDKKVIVWDTAHLCFIMVWLQYFQPDVEYRNGNPITKTIGGYTYDKVTDSKKVEVIGNIYENPELLKPSTHE